MLRIEAPIIVVDATDIRGPCQLLVRDGRIVGVDENTTQAADIVLDGCAILPGLINCHTHLEFSDLQHPIQAERTFPDWISSVVAHRRSAADISAASNQDFLSVRRAAIQQGLAELAETGTVLACDIVTSPWDRSFLDGSSYEVNTELIKRAHLRSSAVSLIARGLTGCHGDVAVIPMGETIGLEETRLAETYRWARDLIEHRDATELPAAVSPHSPYSLVFPNAAQLLRELPSTVLVAMHVAESLEELQWLGERAGPMAEAFRRIGVPIPEELPTIDDCLGLLAGFDRSLVVHGNYLSVDQLQQLGQSRGISLVYCPRTHIHFGHKKYPLVEAVQSGVRLVVGTDSRASNPDLNLWQDLAAMREAFPSLDAVTAYRMATVDAADAIGVAELYGSLHPGCLVDAAVVTQYDGHSSVGLLEWLTSGSAKARFASLGGLCWHALRKG